MFDIIVIQKSLNTSGTVEDDFDFYPYGEPECVKYNSNNLYVFGGYEIDFETDAYHTPTRQLNLALGRWNRPDPYSGSYDLSNPQSFNRYTYALNNPLSYIDPSGLMPCESCAFGGDGGTPFPGGCDGDVDCNGGYDGSGYCPPSEAYCGGWPDGGRGRRWQ